MLLIKIKRPNTLLERQQWLIDLSTVELRLLVSMHSIRTALTTRQVNETDLTVKATIVFQNHLHDGVWAWTFRVGARATAGTQTHANLESFHDSVDVGDLHLGEVDNINDLFAILATLNGCAIVKQVEELATVDFIEGKVEI